MSRLRLCERFLLWEEGRCNMTKEEALQRIAELSYEIYRYGETFKIRDELRKLLELVGFKDFDD